MSDGAIVKLDSAQRALAECKTLMEAKQIADVAEAARVYLERTNAASDTVARAAEIRTLAERQMGEYLKKMPKNEGGRPKKTCTDSEQVSEATLPELGITRKQSATAQKLASIPEPEFRERIAEVKAAGEDPTPSRVLGKAEPKKTATRFTMPDRALFIARGAISQLETISPADGERVEALTLVRDWCDRKLNSKQKNK